MSRVLITGASGHVGAALLTQLAREDQVLALVHRDSSAARLRALPLPARPEVVVADLAGERLPELLQGQWDVLIHLAAYIPKTRAGEDLDTRQLYAVNVAGTARLLAALGNRVRHCVFCSSLAVYTPVTGSPISLSEQDPQVPGSFYGASKLAAEKIAQMWAKDSGASLSILRIGTVYGPGEALVRALPTFFNSARAGTPIFLSGFGRARRNYVYVADVARAIVQAARERLAGVINVGGDEIFTLRELADAVVKTCASSSAVHLLPGPVDDVVLDMRLAHERLGLRCPTSLKNGLAAQYAWLRAEQAAHVDPVQFLVA